MAASRCALAIVAGLAWIWAVALLAMRHHLLVESYLVIPADGPLWQFLALPDGVLLLILAVGVLLAALCVLTGEATRRVLPPPTVWLLLSGLIPALALWRRMGVQVPMTLFEPLFVAWITGAAAGGIARVLDVPERFGRRLAAIPAWVVPWLMAAGAGAWWYYQGQRAYDDYLLGFSDFGHFAFRVASTWEGRGFLMETPSLPPFWDHFNPGLALLAPLWGLWPDARLFILIQAICLSLPAPLVYGIARRPGAGRGTAVAWSAAYLMFPAVGQLNLNYTYGWHPVSLALPLIFATLLALLSGRRMVALAAAVLACSFKEDVVVSLGCLAAAMALEAWLLLRRQSESRRTALQSRPAQVGRVWRPVPLRFFLAGIIDRRRARQEASCASQSPGLAGQLPWAAWLAAAAVLAVAFVLIFKLAGFSGYQVSRFGALGSSTGEVLLSPLVRPRLFWGTVLRPRCIYFLLCLLVPLGPGRIFRGWPFVLACVPPITVLVAWRHSPATSIAFQYTTTLIPLLFLAAMSGSSSDGARSSPAGDPAGRTKKSFRVGGATALAASAAASLWIGALPWSSPTLTDVIAQTYIRQDGDPSVLNDRRAGSPGNAFLNEVVARIGTKQSSVLATARIASHLLQVRRLDIVGHARNRWKAFAAEAGPGRSAIELFDWVVLDTQERFQQSGDDLRFVLDEARRAGYRLTQSAHGILVLARPESPGSSPAGKSWQ